ncbi:hypothetical protein C8Q79DRAFT_1009878 [Trametes meyenii]|nr:hypothetical protein C8Q79DRAFT_1009878 [Trametes meyenii]
MASQEAYTLRQEMKKKEARRNLQASLVAQQKRVAELDAEIKQVSMQGQALAHKLEKEVHELESAHMSCCHKIDARDAEISRLKEEQRTLTEGFEKRLLQTSNENLVLRESEAALRQKLGDVLDELSVRNLQVGRDKNGSNQDSQQRWDAATLATASTSSGTLGLEGSWQARRGLTPQSGLCSSQLTPAHTWDDRQFSSRKPHSAPSRIALPERGRRNPPSSVRRPQHDPAPTPLSLTPHTNHKSTFGGLGFDMLLWEEHIRQVSV